MKLQAVEAIAAFNEPLLLCLWDGHVVGVVLYRLVA